MAEAQPAVQASPDGIAVTRMAERLLPDAGRTIARMFWPGEWALIRGRSRLEVVVDRVLALPEGDVAPLLDSVRDRFARRHRDLDRILTLHYEQVAARDRRLREAPPSPQCRLLLGAYFTNEYAIEAAAFTNPSMVPAPDQDGLADGQRRFVMSVRAVGEGHISSIELRTGVVGADGAVTVDAPVPFIAPGTRSAPLYDRALFVQKLGELEADGALVDRVVGSLPPAFRVAQLEEAIAQLYRDGVSESLAHETVRLIHWLASSNYVVTFPVDTDLSERVLFPAGPTESQGMEDTRLVRFVDEDGSVTYYGTYTAYDGYNILPQLLQTDDFREFRIATLNGSSVSNKGMALFPRQVGGRYAALARHDRESIHYMTSDNVRFWNTSQLVQIPRQPWELVQIGNCGSPLETEAGWLVLTHGVGPMRTYAIGAMLLDLEDPSRVIAQLPEPLLEPDGVEERDGYVPNVIYSCGGMLHEGRLVLPYGFSDLGTGIATVDLDDLLDTLLANPVRA